MYPARLRYLRPSTVDETVDVLADLGSDARVLAGGASLIPQLKYRQVAPQPAVLLDIAWLEELRGTLRQNGHLVVGPMTRHVEAGDDEDLAAAVPAARDAARSIGDPQVRNMGTVGGGLVAVEPTGDWGPCLLAAEGHVRVVSREGQRDVIAQDLFAGPLRTTLRPDELVTGVVFPVPPDRSGSAHAKLYVRAVTALGSCSVALTLDDDDRIKHVRVGVGGLTPYPVAVPAVSQVLEGQGVSAQLIDAGRAALAAALETHSDARTTAAHRSSVAGSLFRQAFRAAHTRALASQQDTTRGVANCGGGHDR